MRIVFVIGNLTNGGAQRVISVVASRLARQGQEVFLLLFNRSPKEYPLDSRVRVHALRESFEEYQKMSKAARVRELRSLLRQLKPEAAVGFTEGGYALFLASLGMKFAKIASARIDPNWIWQQKGLTARINKLWFARADAIVVQTARQRAHMPRKLRDRCTVIFNPVSPHALQSACRTEDSCRRFVMAGRLEEQKNYPMALEAVGLLREEFPDLRLDIFGKGSLLEVLQKKIEALGLQENVRLLGWTEDTVAEYAVRDAYLLTSDFEGMPNALMEAMAVGLPCIATDCDTGPEDLIVHGESGYLVPVGDAKALALQMRQLMLLPAGERAALGRAARSRMEQHFREEMIAQSWLELLNKVRKS